MFLFFIILLIYSTELVTEDWVFKITFIFVFILIFVVTSQLLILCDYELNIRSSTEYSQQSRIFIIPIYQEPVPSYESLFGMNSSPPPPYEIVTKKEDEDSLKIVCLE